MYTKAFYLVTASQCSYDEYDSIVVVANSKRQAIKEALTDGGDNGLRYPHFADNQGPFSAERLNPRYYIIGDKPIASFRTG
jgi:hypothetical protein